ncbi:NAD(P)/FAD-dependent oxidoreductase [Mesorhizobium sp. B1-1-8]|uniref:NAD(P)/FAD-dependent oxidoreductase n=1 Tax=Mesorhizobium sp. B1-1-8 TaxID=2589976 RepID=UPI00112CAF5D|nr:NAD(P)/FAD-dependent oxidoreductase [Mesorhizobium sp. B1-1-8]UCI05188.1 NAD(P)/FAD-dependent oxidoreductase [Mesorhizobium sp. B1-1-8]
MLDLTDPPETAAEGDSSRTRRPRVVIIGAGFAGVAAVRALRKSDVELVLIDRRNHHIFQPLLYQVATAVLAPSEIAAPIRQLESQQANLNVMLAEIVGIDLHHRTVDALYPELGINKVRFDFLVVATGTHPSYFGHDEFAAFAPGLKNLRDAETIRTKILSAFELAEATDDENERARQMNFVLVGAGPTGVELAASIAHMVKVTLRRNFRRIDPATSTITLIEGGDRVLSSFPPSLSGMAAARLAKLGVNVMTGAKVDRVDAQGVITGGDRIPSATVLWTAGVTASPVVGLLGVKTDRAGRALVEPFLNLPGEPNVFVAGDAASIKQDEHPVPGVAQAAIQQGRYIGRLISDRINGREPTRGFRYRDKGNMAVVGKNFAVLDAGRVKTGGFLTWFVWVFIHLMALPQLQNRWRVQSQWLWSYLTGQRSSRLIPETPRPNSASVTAEQPPAP